MNSLMLSRDMIRLDAYYRKTGRFVASKNVAHIVEGNFRCDNDGKAVTAVLPFDVEDMQLLITAYDGYVLLTEELERIFEIKLTEGCFEDALYRIKKPQPFRLWFFPRPRGDSNTRPTA